MAKIVTIDGNIGAGKTTVLEYIGSLDPKIRLDLEPVAKWQPWLDKMYLSGTGVFEFQTRVWLDRCWPKMPNDNEVLFIERSPLFQLGVFVPANITNGKLTKDQGDIVNELYDKTLNMWQPDVYIYLQSDPAKCAERIIRRGRNSEDNIQITYLKELHNLHEATTTSSHNSGKKIQVVNVENKTVAQIADEIMKLI
jgi:deoxyadenosine/deoxycytidine kinase